MGQEAEGQPERSLRGHGQRRRISRPKGRAQTGQTFLPIINDILHSSMFKERFAHSGLVQAAYLMVLRQEVYYALTSRRCPAITSARCTPDISFIHETTIHLIEALQLAWGGGASDAEWGESFAILTRLVPVQYARLTKGTEWRINRREVICAARPPRGRHAGGDTAHIPPGTRRLEGRAAPRAVAEFPDRDVLHTDGQDGAGDSDVRVLQGQVFSLSLAVPLTHLFFFFALTKDP